jgi:ATP-dependent helicase HepA
MGVAASIFTHQVANAFRILTDVRVRHLLADEVGLGKTVQALMVINALRSQRPDLRVLIIVPDQLVPQWRDEILTRAHSAPTGDEADTEAGQFVRLAWEGQRKKDDSEGESKWSLADIDASRYDMLVVDELHRLPAPVQDKIVRASVDFEHVLVLTATPAFQQMKRHAQLFAILEPERTRLTRWLPVAGQDEEGPAQTDLDANSDWSEAVTEQIVNTIIERDRAAMASCGHTDLEAVALSHCAYRRVLRTRRVDFGGVLPRRQHIPVSVEPLGVEAERQALMWRYFGYLGDLTRTFDPVLIAKRVILSPPSLEQRVDFLRRKGHEREGLLEQVKPLVHKSNGDSRADALVDLLREIWANDVNERVLVAAQDSLTVDYLFDLVRARLPEIGPFGGRIRLVAARVRQGMATEAVEDLAGRGNETNENLEAFQRGDAKVLFAPEAAQVGLNLQCARVLILYSVPWRPEEVEQWIGRLDRIGNAAAFSAEGGAREIDIYTIEQHGLVDEKVVGVLKHFAVFERGVNLDGDHLEELTQLIENAALHPEKVNWKDIERRTDKMASADAVQELDSPLKLHLPWSVGWAKALSDQVDAMPPVAPVLTSLPEHARFGPKAWDRALKGLIELLDRAGEYQIRTNKDPTGVKFRTLWYSFGERGSFGPREVQSRVVFSFGACPAHERSPTFAHAFIHKRGDIGTPPRRSVTLRVGQAEVRRPLRFFNFGDQLHDEVVKGWLPDSGQPPVFLVVSLFGDHDLFASERCNPGTYFVRICTLDPTLILLDGSVEERALRAIGLAAGEVPSERLIELIGPSKRMVRCALEADARWLGAQLPSALRVEGLRYSKGGWDEIAPDDLALLLNPMAHGREGLPRSSTWEANDAERIATGAAAAQLRRDDDKVAKGLWSHRLDNFNRALAVRLEVVACEGEDSQAVASHLVDDAEARLEAARARGNTGQVTRAENDLVRAIANCEMITAFWEQRRLWLQDCATAVLGLQPQEQISAALRVKRVSDVTQ